ncbi:MAG: tRNA pseudouridine(55) synthase TruB [Candidatus Latescibacteria bacterium]|nr:tRNA pseudouridine(55) synthase TruB [Candidatus Latescibacterota bacterium]
MSELNGILIIDKPHGWTSHDVVKKIRNLLGHIKVGHTGTLDPNATGVLVLLIGKATKLAQQFENDSKKYDAEITFGWSTDTYDSDGKTTATGDIKAVDLDNLKSIINEFIGESRQLPPMFSAVKVNGKKLYQLARKGISVDRKPRKIIIKHIDSDLTDFPKIRLEIDCSKGTYIRSIAHDLGEKAGCPSHLSALRRTASGIFTIYDAINLLSISTSNNRAELIQHIRPVSTL